MTEFTRLEGWETRLFEAVAPHLSAPFAYGKSDCFMLAMDALQAVTGADPYGDHRGAYSTAPGAAKQLARRGFTTLEDAMDALCSRVAPSMAQRGDIASLLSSDGPALAVVVGGSLVSKGEAGVIIHPLWVAMNAWRVG